MDESSQAELRLRLLVDAGETGRDAVIRGLSHPEARVRRGRARFTRVAPDAALTAGGGETA